MPPLSVEQRRAIAFHAMTVYERVEAARLHAESADTSATGEANAALFTWSGVFSPSDREAFLRRLHWDGLDWTMVAQAISAGGAGEGRSVPEWFEARPDGWTRWLDALLEHTAEVVGAVAGRQAREPGHFDAAVEPPFIELGMPALLAARRALLARRPSAYEGLTDAARRDVERPLLHDVLVFAERTLFTLFRQVAGSRPSGEGGDTPSDEKYLAFIVSMLDDSLPALFVAYPVLARVISQVMECWVDSTADLTARLAADRGAIARELGGGSSPGSVVSIAPALSDPHDGRRRVASLTFESGLRVIYKPRSVGAEHALSDVLEWANRRGLEPAQVALRVLERNGYGWVEFADQGSFDDRDAAGRYYRQAGGLMAIAHLLRSTDLHMENIVATRRGPVLVDPELTLQPTRERETQPGAAGPASEPCVASGILTFAEVGADGGRYETGGLRGEGLRGSARPRRSWKGQRTDGLHFVEEHEFDATAANRVTVGGVVQHPEYYRDDLLAGFAATYRFFSGRRDEILGAGGPLAAFAARTVRVMFRATNQYAVVQDLLAAPKYQQSGVARSCALDVLARPFALDRDRPAAWPILVAERRALERLDIPRFTVEANGIAVGADHEVAADGVFTRSGLDAVRERIAALSEQDLGVQLEWIVRSLSESATSRFRAAAPALRPGGPAADATADEMLAVAVWIGREYLQRAERSGGGLAWTLQPPGSEVAGVAAHFLDSGSLGPPLFLAALARATGEASWADAARMACLPACTFFERAAARRWPAGEPIGAGTGWGSIVYGLLWIGRLLEDEQYVRLARRVAESIDASHVATDNRLDILSGSAGAILALLALTPTAGDGVTDLAVACGDHLLATQVHTHWGSAWPSRDRRMLAGFAHGAAGIAYALVRLHQATGTRAYLDAAVRAHRYERAVFSPVHRNWPVLRAAGHLPGNVAVPMTAWCHGAPGIALARALVGEAVAGVDADVAFDLEVALETTAKLPGSAADHLCCGNAGRCDVLLTAGEALGRPDLVSAARTIAAKVMRQAVRRGKFEFVSPAYEYAVFDAGFFYGLAGIGYALLRVAAPSRLPSILAFEPRLADDSGTRREAHVPA
ncbi:MAG: type 2 lanthipeptide synthetase LanM [Betaproteobacteria bacterium]